MGFWDRLMGWRALRRHVDKPPTCPTPVDDALRALEPMSLQRALQVLSEGIPGRNDPQGHLIAIAGLQNLLANAAYTVVSGTDPSSVFDNLAHYFDASEMVCWFGKKRAELILHMLLFQCGCTCMMHTGTWLYTYATKLAQLGTRPDRRWLEVCLRVNKSNFSFRTKRECLKVCNGDFRNLKPSDRVSIITDLEEWISKHTDVGETC